jgi:hypothetical protein
MRLSGVRSSESADKGSQTLNPRLYEFSEFLLVGRGLASIVRQWYVNMKCIHPNPGVTTKISARLRMVCSDCCCLRPCLMQSPAFVFCDVVRSTSPVDCTPCRNVCHLAMK